MCACLDSGMTVVAWRVFGGEMMDGVDAAFDRVLTAGAVRML